MIQFRLLLLFCLLPVWTTAQVVKEYSVRREIYRLNASEAQQVYVKKAPFDSLWLHTLVAGNDTIRPSKLPAGHYLTIMARQEQIVAEINSNFPFAVQVLDTRRDFAFTVTDTSGAGIHDAVVVLNHKRVPFDEKMQCYRLEKRKKGGMLEIKTKDDTWFYQVEVQNGPTIFRQRWRRFAVSPAGKVIGLPYDIARSVLQNPKRAKRVFNKIIYTHESKLNRRNRFRGYVAFSQPKYRPGDTLEVKAWVEARKGKPWNKPLDLLIREEEKYKTIKNITLNPVKPGHFEFQMVMTDSLPVDRDYGFDFYEKNPRKRGIFHRFEPKGRGIKRSVYYEDYVLDEVKYTFRKDKETYFPEDSVVLHLSAKDGNNQPIPDGRYNLVVHIADHEEFYAPEVYLPDTLWRTEGAIPVSGELHITIPDALFPPAKYTLNADIYCVNSAGELQVKNLSFEVDRQPVRLIAAIQKGRFSVNWPDKITNPGKATITEIRNDQEDYIYEVPLPYSSPVKTGVTTYTIDAGNETYDLDPNDDDAALDEVFIDRFRLDDTVVFIMQNPQRIPIQYRIFRDKSLFEEGIAGDSQWVKIIIDPGKNNFLFTYSFIWGGEAHEHTTALEYFSKILHVEIDQPAKVVPGETVQIKVKVTGENKKPMASADITAGAVNTLFNDTSYGIPDISQRTKPKPLVYRSFEINPVDERSFTLPLNEKWYSRLHLDQNAYYQLRHLKAPGDATIPAAITLETPVTPNAFLDEAGHTIVYPEQKSHLPDIAKFPDSFYLNRPQFAPFVIENYKSQSVYLIWVNKRLVYYHNTGDVQPYSFYGNYGYNTITVRTRDGEYTLDSVYFEKGQKHTLAFYGEGWNNKPQKVNTEGKTFQKTHIKWEFRPDTLTAFEQNYLRQSIFSFLPLQDYKQKIFIWESSDNIHRITERGYNKYAVGPFPPGTNLKALFTDAFFTEFRFEPGFDHQLLPGRERLYASKAWWLQTKLPKFLPVKPINQWAVGPHQIQSATMPTPQRTFLTSEQYKRGTGRLEINFSQRDTVLFGFALKSAAWEGPYRANTTIWTGLTPGRYTFYIFTKKGSVASREIIIRRDTLTFIDITNIKFHPADSPEGFDYLFPPINLSPPAGEKTIPRSAPMPSGYSDLQFGAIIEGIIKDDDGEVLIGAAVKVLNGTFFLRGAITDIDGHYRLTNIPPGTWDLEVNYTGYTTRLIQQIEIREGLINYVDAIMQFSTQLQAVEITAYKIPLIQQDMTSAGMTFTSDEIRTMPTRSINALLGTVAGLSNIDGGDVNIKGSRSTWGNYYVDGILLNDGEIPLSDIAMLTTAPSPRSYFKDHAFFRPDLTTDDNGEAVFQVTFPDNITGWNSYVIAAGGKGRFGIGTGFTRSFKPVTAQLAVPRFAVAGDHFEVAGRVSNYTGDSLTMIARFKVNDRITAEKTVRLGEGWSEFSPVDIPETGIDTVSVAYETEAGKAADGEMRQIPVLPLGVMETTGQFFFLENDTTVRFTPDPARGPVTFYAQNNVLDLLLADAEYLRLYPYGCNEQIASRLTALLALKKIMSHQQKPFKYEKDIYICLKRLKTNQLPNGSWGWWAEGAPNNWMTLYVAKTLQKARVAGYQTPGLDEAIALLQLLLPAMHYADQRETLAFLRTCRINIDCQPYLTRYDSLANRMDYGLVYKLNTMKMKQLCDLEVEKDSLLTYLKHTTFGGIYCGLESTNWYNRRAVNTLLAYDIANTAGWTDITNGIRRYWLETRKEQRNTIETAQILDILLPEILSQTNANTPTVLTVGQQQCSTTGLRPVHIDNQSNGPIFITKTGPGPIFVNIYQQWQNTRPEPRSDIFEVKTRLLTAEDKPVNVLKYGEAATLEVTVKVKAAADYVMIEAPIPAGCGYGTKIQPYRPEMHREYFKDRTAIFCEQLSVGEYTFRIPLEARFTGQFTINPAKAEQMYFPVFYGRNKVGSISIGK